jgi:hypothetical protein
MGGYEMEASVTDNKYHDTFNDLLETYNAVKAFEQENAYKVLTNYSYKSYKKMTSNYKNINDQDNEDNYKL